MNRMIRRLTVGILAMYSVLFIQLNNVQLFGAQRLKDNPDNTRALIKARTQPRGPIVTADGVVVAHSDQLAGTDTRQRVYPTGALFAHTVGYFSIKYGADGVEKTYNKQLVGDTTDLKYQGFEDLFTTRDTTGTVTLTLRNDVQTVARDALGDLRGSVVAIDPRTGEVLAMYSNPSYDPNPVASTDNAISTFVKTALDSDANKPLLARAYRETYFPGSTFKVVTAAAGLELGTVTPDSPTFANATGYKLPFTNNTLSNFGGESCGGTLFEVLRDSCNSAFAQMGAEYIGPEPMVERAQAFGFDAVPPIDLPAAAKSVFPTDYGPRSMTVDQYRQQQSGQPPASTTPGTTAAPGQSVIYLHQNSARLAQASIGQNDVQASPLQMALVTAGIANGGVVMKPHVVRDVRNADGGVVETTRIEPWRTAITPQVAATLRDGMKTVVESGTATRLAIDGFEVGGKTGTAQLGTTPPKSHAWIIGYAGDPGKAARVAVAVIIEGQEGTSEQTGGRVAAPIAQAVLKAALGV
jgi:peptidoglycan glycosyltransferase